MEKEKPIDFQAEKRKKEQFGREVAWCRFQLATKPVNSLQHMLAKIFFNLFIQDKLYEQITEGTKLKFKIFYQSARKDLEETEDLVV